MRYVKLALLGVLSHSVNVKAWFPFLSGDQPQCHVGITIYDPREGKAPLSHRLSKGGKCGATRRKNDGIMTGPWKLGRRLGSGNFGTVLEVTLPVQSSPGRFKDLRYALKAIPFSSENPRLVNTELNMLKELSKSSFIVRLYHDWTEPFNKSCPDLKEFFGDMQKVEDHAKRALSVRKIDSVAFIVMELSGQRHNGRNVKSPTDYMKTNPRPKDVVIMFLCLAQGLKHMHSLDILHRDIKPDNCLVSCGDDASRSKTAIIGDLGLATYITECRGGVAGDSRYYPRGLRHNTKESDVYALGKTFQEILHRNRRVQGPAIDQVRRLITSMMATTGNRRGVRCRGPPIEKVVNTFKDIFGGRAPTHQPVRRLSDPGRRPSPLRRHHDRDIDGWIVGM